MIKFVFKWAFRLLLLAVLLAVILFLSMDSLLRVYMEHRIRAQTGMDAEIGRVSVGLIEPRMEIRDLKLFNPPEFGGTPFLDIPEIHVEYDRLALSEHRLHLTLLRFNLGEVDIVKDETGHTNIFALGLALPVPVKKTGAPATGGVPAPPDFQKQTGLAFEAIDALNVSIGTLKYVDLQDSRHNRTQKIGIENFVVKHVKAPSDLIPLSVLVTLRSGDFFTLFVDQKNPAGTSELLKLLF